MPIRFSKFLISRLSLWFWLTMAVSILTVVAVFTDPSDVLPLVYLRQILGPLFVLFLPGFVFIKTLYPSKAPLASSSEYLGTIEQVALSFGLSIALVATTGLVLNYTPWGIRLSPITICLFALTMITAAVALLREYHAKTAIE